MKTFGADFCNAMVFLGLSISVSTAIFVLESASPFWGYALMFLFISTDKKVPQ